jgi:hypothetical protein
MPRFYPLEPFPSTESTAVPENAEKALDLGKTVVITLPDHSITNFVPQPGWSAQQASCSHLCRPCFNYPYQGHPHRETKQLPDAPSLPMRTNAHTASA